MTLHHSILFFEIHRTTLRSRLTKLRSPIKTAGARAVRCEARKRSPTMLRRSILFFAKPDDVAAIIFSNANDGFWDSRLSSEFAPGTTQD
ncbi:hypothetical protein MRB53_013459 [Persea americana]|uniref:Uncharacterized protein n=1 Tax=Persea americana TaxID=3435 RepID=A0ACC2K809_PERAE|nr:hypothetical protein MRB53_013459 [Persea americana]